MSKDPAVLFYTGDFLNGCTDLTFEERGQYITLLCLQHLKGNLSEKTIRLTLGSVSDDVLKKFKIDENGNYYHKRMQEEMEKRQHFLDTRTFNGKKGGRPKEPNNKPNGLPNNKPNGEPTDNLSINENEDQKNIIKGVPQEINLLQEIENEHTIEKRRLEKIKNVYNKTELPKIREITDQRKKRVNARIDQHGFDVVLKVLQKVEDSNFLCGKNDQGWCANFDWIFNTNNFVKIMDGFYENRKGTTKGGNSMGTEVLKGKKIENEFSRRAEI